MSLESTNDDSDDEDLAIDYSNSLMAFRRLYTTNKERFEKLNWIGVDRKIIDELFPVDVKSERISIRPLIWYQQQKRGNGEG